MRLAIPTPCTQDWDTMTPAGQGRHCAACQKVVVDFSRMTDGELVSWMQARAGQAICGRLETGQLGRELVPALPLVRKQPWWSWARVSAAVGALWLVLAGGDANAQARKKLKPSHGSSIPVGQPLQPRTDVPYVRHEARIVQPLTLKPEEKEATLWTGDVIMLAPIRKQEPLLKRAFNALTGVSAERRE